MSQHSTIRTLVLLVAAFSIPCAAARAQALQHSLEGEDLQDHFGYSVGGGRDFDLDGHDDLIVSAGYYLTQEGYVRVLSGRTGEVLYAIESEHLTAGFGSDVASIDDVNGDGVVDALHVEAGTAVGAGDKLVMLRAVEST